MSDPLLEQKTPGSALLALRLFFAANGVGLGLWLPRIPDVKAAIDADLMTLSLCFLMLPLGTLLGFGIAQPAVRRLGLRRVCGLFGAAFIVMMGGPALATSAWGLGGILLMTGLTIAPIEVAMNARAGAMEREIGRRIMSGCHGFWSFGSMGGALLAGACAEIGIGFAAQQGILVPALVLLALKAARGLPPDPARIDAAQVAPAFALPAAGVIALCLVPLGALMLEGAMMEWSALFLRDDLGISPLAAAATFAGFAFAMGIARLLGDRLADWQGPRRVLVASALLASLGMACFATASTLAVAAPAAVALGLGIANIYPLVVSLAADLPVGTPERNIAAVAFSAFAMLLAGPPVIGALGSLWGLPVALTLLVPLAFYPALMGRFLEPSAPQALSGHPVPAPDRKV